MIFVFWVAMATWKPIARKKNLITLCSATFVTILLCTLVQAYKFYVKSRQILFWKKLDNPEINHQLLISPPSFKGIENKKGNEMGIPMSQIFLIKPRIKLNHDKNTNP